MSAGGISTEDDGTLVFGYGNNEQRFPAGSAVIWSVNRASSYDVDEDHLVLRPDFTAALVSAYGCSCWEGDYTVNEMGTLAEALSPLGVPEQVRDEAFNELLVLHDVASGIGWCPCCAPRDDDPTHDRPLTPEGSK